MRPSGTLAIVDFAKAGASSGTRQAKRSRRAFLTGTAVACRREEPDYWIRVHRRAMACRFEITLASQDAWAVPAARAALNEVDRLEEELSVFRETSAISRINREASDTPVPVSPELLSLLADCGALHRRTAGAFDITSTPLSRCWGFLHREGCLPSPAAIDEARARVGFDGVRLDALQCTVGFDRRGLELNLGAIGKGYALDRIAVGLRAAGVTDALLSAGQSSLLAIGGRDRGWHVEITSPRDGGIRLAHVWLRDAALGTSGAGEQFVIADGRRYGHVIDPRTGWPASGVVSASVIAPRAADADALSTAFLIDGADLARRDCDAHADVTALITTEGSDAPLVIGGRHGACVDLSRSPR
jgi:thiamine biosynthesis lipoprotein